jgi:subtilisin family serine protease
MRKNEMVADTWRKVSTLQKIPRHVKPLAPLYASLCSRWQMRIGVHGLVCFGLCVWVVLLGSPRAWGENFRRIIVFQAGTPVVVQKEIVVESGSTLLHILPLVNAVVVKLPAEQAEQALSTLQSRPEVVQIHEDPAVSAEGLAASEGVEGSLITPTHAPSERERWNFDQIDFDLGKGKYKRRGIRIAVLDTGIDYLHPDLARRVVSCYNARAGEPETDCIDYNGHGTHVAGIIAASVMRSNGKAGRVPGMAPLARLYAVRVLDNAGGGFVSDVINGLSWVYNHPEIRLINMSLGFYKTSPYPLLQRIVTMLYEAGVIIVASAGNYRAECIAIVHQVAEGEGGEGEGGDAAAVLDANGQPCNRLVKFPARYPETIAVAATDSKRDITNYSIRGLEVDVAAPGGSRLRPVISTMTTQRLPVAGSTCVFGASVSTVAPGADEDSQGAAGEGGDSQVVATGEGGDCSVAAVADENSQGIAAGEGGDSQGVAGEGGDSQVVTTRKDGQDQMLYGAGSGTSQAAAHVTGLIANLLSKNPLLTLDDIRMILNATAVDLSVSTLSQGAGLIDVEEAVDLGETWR